MTPDCGILNPLQRDGTSQDQRLVRALHPSYVQLDERGLHDLLVYAVQYAALLRYYSPSNRPEGDWKALIETDVSTLVAIIRTTSLASIKARQEAATSLEDRFPPFFELVQLADRWLQRAPAGLRIHQDLVQLVRSLLNDSLRNVMAYGLRLIELGLSLPAEYTQAPALNASTWDVAHVQADHLLFPSNDLSDAAAYAQAMGRLHREFLTFHDGLASLIQKAEGYLKETLEQYPQHQPHMGLFLAFLKLFQVAQGHQNTLTRRHLNFYFREVLQIDPIPAQADEVHLVFQLAKGFEEQLVKQGTDLKAGKDANKAQVFFELDENLLVNRVQLDEVDGLKTIFLNKEYLNAGAPLAPDTPYLLQGVHAAPIANSADGLGEIIVQEDGKWQTMGSTDMPDAQLGFAIASPLFLLAEGQRRITVDLYFEDTEPWPHGLGTELENRVARELQGNLLPAYTSEGSWVSTQIDEVVLSREEDALRMRLVVALSGEEPAVSPYDAEVYPEGYATSYPIIRFLLDPKGLDGEVHCAEEAFLITKAQAATRMPTRIQARILQFLNQVESWQDITALKPQRDPVVDNPFFPRKGKKPLRAHDIGEEVAREILRHRQSEAVGGQFTDIGQVAAVKGLGVDKLNDLYYSFCADPIAEIKRNARPYDAALTFMADEVALFEGHYYQALVDAPSLPPSASNSQWRWIPWSHPYQYFQFLQLQKLELEVEVVDMKALVLENDNGGINPAKPFQPFGPQPKVGSNFFIGSPEVFAKRLSGTDEAELELKLEWADLPEESFDAHYDHYTDKVAPLNNNAFTVSVEKLEGGRWVPLGSGPEPLFASSTASAPSPVPSLSLENVFSKRKPELGDFGQLSPDQQRGFLRLVLQKNFFHANYPTSLAEAVKPGGDAVPNQPYTPTLSGLKLTYRSREVIDFLETPFDQRVEQLFHLEPFGWKEVYPFGKAPPPEEAVASRRLVPRFELNEPLGNEGEVLTTDAEGTLYLGLVNAKPPQSISILFQVAEGSADPDLPAQAIIWSYLSHNEWVDFNTSEILSDSTNGLLNSGIITFALPRAANAVHTRLKNGLHWIKGSVARHTPAINQAIAVMPQAVKATFDLRPENDPHRLSSPLPAETISKLRKRQAAIKKVLQPFASFGGKVQERITAPEGVTGEAVFAKRYNEYYIRASERLRHKQRGITIYDYERLVLQQFPDVYKVKCLNHTRIASSERAASEHAPGHVKLIVIPHLRNQNAVDPMRPKLSLGRLQAIKEFLSPLISDFVTLEVKNPVFEEIQVHFNVKFHPLQDANRGHYEQVLIEDIKQFLAPWLYEAGESLSFGGRVHRSLILNYIEERSYVDAITDFRMDHLRAETDLLEDVEEAVASTSSSVLVSATTHHVSYNIDLTCQTQASS